MFTTPFSLASLHNVYKVFNSVLTLVSFFLIKKSFCNKFFKQQFTQKCDKISFLRIIDLFSFRYLDLLQYLKKYIISVSHSHKIVEFKLKDHQLSFRWNVCGKYNTTRSQGSTFMQRRHFLPKPLEYCRDFPTHKPTLSQCMPPIVFTIMFCR